MTLVAYGINHSTATIDIREKVCFGNEVMPDALNELKRQNGVYEAAILSTCNRTEIYCSIDEGKNHNPIELLHNYHGMEKGILKPFLYLQSLDMLILQRIRTIQFQTNPTNNL